MKFCSIFQKVIAVGVFVSTPFVYSQRTFDEYFKMVKTHQVGQRETEFLKECAVDPEGVPVYGVRLDVIPTERWSPRPLLGKGIEERFAHDFYTVEIREAVGGKARFINTWWITKETGESQNAMFCLNDAQKVEGMQTLNIYDPPGGGPSVRYLLRQHVGISGKTSDLHGMFVDMDDKPVTAPKLNKREMVAAQMPATTEGAYAALRDLWGKMRPRGINDPYVK